MSGYRIVAVQTQISNEVRVTGRSPGYGHPAVREVATGTGPCRSCLGLFSVEYEERLLFTYQPASGEETLGAPGPVFIHAEDCGRFEGVGFPEDLLRLPLLVEGRTHDGRVLRSERTPGEGAEDVIGACFAEPEIDFLFLRHGEAGCHIARVDRS